MIGVVFARMGLLLVNDLAPVNAVLQYQVERAARRMACHPTIPPEALVRNLLWMLSGLQLVSQPPDRAELGIAAKNQAHDFRLAVDR